MELTKEQREKLLDKIQATVSTKYYDPAFDKTKWQALVSQHREAIIGAGSTADFEKNISKLLNELSPRTLGLLSKHTPITPRNAINASFSVHVVDGERRWVFQDVLPGGVASTAGAKSGDVLLTIDGTRAQPAEGNAGEPHFEMRETITLTVARGIPARETTLLLKTASPKYKDNPYSEPKALVAEDKGNGTAYLKVNLFPGKIGIDFARELDELFKSRFASAQRLLIDLRGNPGGGIGGLALMSYLTPNRLPIGYSKNRKMAQDGQDPSTLPVFSKVPRSKLAIPGLALKFAGKTSVHLYTEALGQQSFKGKVVILVNEHSTGAAEMLAQFAQENQLATILGTKTPGRMVSRTATKLGNDYRLVVPVAAYISGKGKQIEGNGIVPDVEVPWSYQDAVAGKDNQLEAAIALES